MQTTHEILVRTKAASRALASVGQADKEHLLLCMADSLLAHEGDILAANARDMAASAGVITPVMADRLLLTDKRIAGMAHNGGTAVVLLLNKWDLIDTAERREELENDLAERLHFVSYAPVVRISALTGRSCLRVWDAVNVADANHRKVIPTPQLNKLLTEIREFGHTVTKGSKRLKMNYITQTGNKPPIFTIFVNMPELITPNYEHFLENRIRDRFDLTGTPIRFKFKRK